MDSGFVKELEELRKMFPEITSELSICSVARMPTSGRRSLRIIDEQSCAWTRSWTFDKIYIEVTSWSSYWIKLTVVEQWHG